MQGAPAPCTPCSMRHGTAQSVPAGRCRPTAEAPKRSRNLMLTGAVPSGSALAAAADAGLRLVRRRKRCTAYGLAIAYELLVYVDVEPDLTRPRLASLTAQRAHARFALVVSLAR